MQLIKLIRMRNINFLKAEKVSDFKLAVSATLHCLVGCGIGEVLGMILGAYFGWGMIDTMIVAITLGFVFGFTGYDTTTP